MQDGSKRNKEKGDPKYSSGYGPEQHKLFLPRCFAVTNEQQQVSLHVYLFRC